MIPMVNTGVHNSAPAMKHHCPMLIEAVNKLGTPI
jgi:hypothetical protein